MYTFIHIQYIHTNIFKHQYSFCFISFINCFLTGHAHIHLSSFSSFSLIQVTLARVYAQWDRNIKCCENSNIIIRRSVASFSREKILVVLLTHFLIWSTFSQRFFLDLLNFAFHSSSKGSRPNITFRTFPNCSHNIIFF